MEIPDAMRDFDSEEQLRQARRAKKRAQMRRQQRRRARQRRMLVFGIACCLLIFLAGLGVHTLFGKKDREEPAAESQVIEAVQADQTDETAQQEPQGQELVQEELKESQEEEPVWNLPFMQGYTFASADTTTGVNEETVPSKHVILVDLDQNTIRARRGEKDRISPASMTKILTVLVAAEHITDLDDTFTITREITDYSYSNDCSAAGFGDGETVMVRDLMYGTILPSGADAAAGLAYYVSGSLEGFVQLMNEKIEELGLSGTSHFTNCVGLYDEDHYCTAEDMAVMLKAAVENELCREVLSAHTYKTSTTEQHPDGIELSNWFLRRIEDKDTKGEVVCAKTGYVIQSGNCAASYMVTDSGKHYICVTADAYSSWRCIYDHVAVYQQYTE